MKGDVYRDYNFISPRVSGIFNVFRNSLKRGSTPSPPIRNTCRPYICSVCMYDEGAGRRFLGGEASQNDREEDRILPIINCDFTYQAVRTLLGDRIPRIQGIAGGKVLEKSKKRSHIVTETFATMIYPTALGWRPAIPLITGGQTCNGYSPPGYLDGIAVKSMGQDINRLFVNHELAPDLGSPYTLASGATLVGRRISYFDVHKTTLKLLDAGIAYNTIYNRKGERVVQPSDLKFDGLNRLCTGQYFRSGRSNFVDDIIFVGN